MYVQQKNFQWLFGLGNKLKIQVRLIAAHQEIKHLKSEKIIVLDKSCNWSFYLNHKIEVHTDYNYTSVLDLVRSVD